MSVFDDDVTSLLEQVKETRATDEFDNKDFEFDSSRASMTKDLTGRFKTAASGGDKGKNHRNFLNAALGTLLERQETWGPLFNYPRTFLIGPDASFQCTWRASGGGTWREHMNLKGKDPEKGDPRVLRTATSTESPIIMKDIDQVIWVNHCATEQGVPIRGRSPRLVEVGIVRLRHEAQSSDLLEAEIGAVRFEAGGQTTPYEHKIGDDYKKNEAKKVMLHVFGRSSPSLKDRPVRETRATMPHEKINYSDPGKNFRSFTASGSDDEMSYVTRAVSVIEFVMRNRTESLENLLDFTTQGHAHDDIMYKAVVARQIPYARDDLEKPQPAVMPGKASAEDIVNVMEHVVGYSEGLTSAAIFSTKANPYDAFDDSSADDDTGTLTPFSSSEDELNF